MTTEPTTVAEFFAQYEKDGKIWPEGLRVLLRNCALETVFMVTKKSFGFDSPVLSERNKWLINGQCAKNDSWDITEIPSAGIKERVKPQPTGIDPEIVEILRELVKCLESPFRDERVVVTPGRVKFEIFQTQEDFFRYRNALVKAKAALAAVGRGA